MKNRFRILAIKTFNDFQIEGNSALKVLKENTIYPFYSCFSYPENDFSKVEYHPDQDFDLFSYDELPISISAIVGENGSGKSTLIELLMMLKYNLGISTDVLFKKIYVEKSASYIKEKLNPFTELELEILTENEEGLNKFLFKNGEVTHFLYNKGDISYQLNTNPIIVKKSILESFFYSIVINYSHYAFNSDDIGEWIIPLFHKNDGYQTPVVINPRREFGNIDINNENDLLIERLITNLLEKPEKDPIDSLRNLGDHKNTIIATGVKFNVDKEKTYSFYYDEASLEEATIRPERLLVSEKEFLSEPDHKKYFLQYFKIDFDSGSIYESNDVLKNCLNYILNKAKNIVSRYKPYQKSDFDQVKTGKWSEDFFKEILEDHSHITYKIKQAIFFIKYFDFWRTILPNLTEVPFQTIIDTIEEIKSEIKKDFKFRPQTIQLLPPPIFKKDIVFENGKTLNLLSSGEKQRILSTSSIVYHLINLNSVDTKNGYTRYDYINIVLDEIELYFHPNWQRTYLSDLLTYIKRINPAYLKNIKGLNITFLTHSPFILSDIPSHNILFLKKNETDNSVPVDTKTESFGANIHTLLKDSFFMEGGLIGEFAKIRIQELIEYLKKDSKKSKGWDQKKAGKIIELIGEPVLKEAILEIYQNKFGEKTIEELELENEELRKKIQSYEDSRNRK